MPKRLNAYDRALIQIRDQMLLMSEKVGKRLSEAMNSFINQDVELARKSGFR